MGDGLPAASGGGQFNMSHAGSSSDFPLDVPLAENSGHPQQSMLGVQLTDFRSLCAPAQDLTFWDNPEFDARLFLGPYFDLPFLTSLDQAQGAQIAIPGAQPIPEQTHIDSPAPVLSFCDTRQSPEPQDGQGLSFRELVRKTRTKRYCLRNSEDNSQQELANPTTNVTGTTATSQRTSPMRTFPPILSASASEDFPWEAEDFGHVKQLTQQVYDNLVANFKAFNCDNGHYMPFATGEFLSIAACSAFIQLYFEEFNPLFPILHQPTFDPAVEHWVLILAVIATGCRFSKHPAAGDCVEILQEFLRRGLNTTVSFASPLTHDSEGPKAPLALRRIKWNLICIHRSSETTIQRFSPSLRSQAC